jgi:host factor-I protein
MTNSKPRINIQDQLLYQAKKDRCAIRIFLQRGLMLQGKVISYDPYSILIDGMGKHQLIFKHAISTIDFPPGFSLGGGKSSSSGSDSDNDN